MNTQLKSRFDTCLFVSLFQHSKQLNSESFSILVVVVNFRTVDGISSFTVFAQSTHRNDIHTRWYIYILFLLALLLHNTKFTDSNARWGSPQIWRGGNSYAPLCIYMRLLLVLLLYVATAWRQQHKNYRKDRIGKRNRDVWKRAYYRTNTHNGNEERKKKKTQIISYNKRMGKLHTHHFQRSNRTTTHSIIIIFQLNWFSFAAVAWIGKIQQTHLYDAHLRVLQIGLANKKSTLKIVMYLFFYIYLYIFFADYFCRVCSNTAVHRDLLCVVYLFLFAFYTCFCRKFVASVRLFALFFFFASFTRSYSLALSLSFTKQTMRQYDNRKCWRQRETLLLIILF